MGRRKGRKAIPETLISSQREDEREEFVDEDVGEDGTGSNGRFFACYLLTSLCPRFKGHTYIGFTVNPKRRIRQHNGEIGSGAWRTKKKRPWEMVLCIYGFPTNVTALQFEWAWQHPVESLAVRKAAVNFKSLSGLANKIKLAYTMLTLKAWQSLNLTVNFFSTKYQKHIAGCPTLPNHMRVQVCSMDELPCYTESIQENDDLSYASSDEECLKSVDDREMDAEIDHYLADRQRSLKDSEHNRCKISQEVTHETSFHLNDEFIPGKESYSPLRCNNREENQTWNLDCSVDEYRQVSKNCLITILEDPDSTYCHPGMSKEVEIIDLFTPSPSNKVSKVNKKRRVITSGAYPEIIDLTKSPVFV